MVTIFSITLLFSCLLFRSLKFTKITTHQKYQHKVRSRKCLNIFILKNIIIFPKCLSRRPDLSGVTSDPEIQWHKAYWINSISATLLLQQWIVNKLLLLILKGHLLSLLHEEHGRIFFHHIFSLVNLIWPSSNHSTCNLPLIGLTCQGALRYKWAMGPYWAPLPSTLCYLQDPSRTVHMQTSWQLSELWGLFFFFCFLFDVIVVPEGTNESN